MCAGTAGTASIGQGLPRRRALNTKFFYSVPDLINAIEQCLAAHNTDPKPFVWTASADAILEKVARCQAVFETVH